MEMNKQKFYGIGGIIYPTLSKYRWNNGDVSVYGDFYFLPMLRYMVQGTEEKYLQCELPLPKGRGLLLVFY